MRPYGDTTRHGNPFIKPVRLTYITGPLEVDGTGDTDFASVSVRALQDKGINAHFLRGLTNADLSQDDILHKIDSSQENVEHILHIQLRVPLANQIGSGTIIKPVTLDRFKTRGNKVIITCHEFIICSQEAKALTAEYLKRADRIVFKSRKEQGAFLDYVSSHPECGIDRATIEELCHIVPGSLTILVPESVRENAEKRPPNLICFGMIRSLKGHDKLMDLASMIKQDWRIKLMKALCRARGKPLGGESLAEVSSLYWEKERAVGDTPPRSRQVSVMVDRLNEAGTFAAYEKAVSSKDYDLEQFDPKVIIVGNPITTSVLPMIMARMFNDTDVGIANSYELLTDKLGEVIQQRVSRQPIAALEQRAIAESLHLDAVLRRFEYLTTPWRQLKKVLSGNLDDEKDAHGLAQLLAESNRCFRSHVSKDTIRDLFYLRRHPHNVSNSPIWSTLFIDTILQYLVRGGIDEDPEYIPHERLSFLDGFITEKIRSDTTEGALFSALQRLRSLSKEKHPDLYKQWRATLLRTAAKGGLDESDLASLRQILGMKDVFRQGSVTKKDIEDLIHIDELMKDRTPNPVWEDLFVETLARYSMEGARRPKDVDLEKISWLKTKLLTYSQSRHIKSSVGCLDASRIEELFRYPSLPVELHLDVPVDQIDAHFQKARYGVQFIDRGITSNSSGCSNTLAYGSILLGPVTEHTSDELAASVVDCSYPKDALDALVERMLNPELDKRQSLIAAAYIEKMHPTTSANQYIFIYEQMTAGNIYLPRKIAAHAYLAPTAIEPPGSPYYLPNRREVA